MIKVKFSQWATLVVVLLLSVGCYDPMGGVKANMKKANALNVAKLRTCCFTFASNKDGKAPASKEELIEFLEQPKISKLLSTIGINSNDLEPIFISDRDGEPLKVKWGSRVDPNNPQPLVFEDVGVDGVRLVAGGEVIEVSDPAYYDSLWDGTKKIELASDDDVE